MAHALQDQPIVITGGSGFLGLNLARHLLALGARVMIVSRSRPTISDVDWAQWDGRTVGDWADHLEGAHGVVNLAGRTVDCVKTPANCDEILRSRVETTRAVGEALARCERRPGVWVQMSTAHIYGDPPTARCDESSAFGYGLAPKVGRAWEAAHREALPADMRSVVLRTSFVLGKSGGAMTKLGRLARWGLGGRIASGEQGMSWIHEHDMNRLFERALADGAMEGAYLATAPNPVSNAVFMRALRRAVGMPIGLPAPAIGVRIAAPWILRTDPELALYGRYCASTRLEAEGFVFEFPEIEGAMGELYSA